VVRQNHDGIDRKGRRFLDNLEGLTQIGDTPYEKVVAAPFGRIHRKKVPPAILTRLQARIA